MNQQKNNTDIQKNVTYTSDRSANHSVKSLSNEELLSNTKLAAQNEKAATLRLLDCLAEVESRRLYSLRAYSSLWEFVVKELHYSESQASERIHAMRLLKKVPEVKKHIEEGELSMTTAAQINRFLHQESKASSRKWQSEKTNELIAQCKHKSKREVEALLVAESEHPIEKPRDKERLISAELRELKFAVSKEVSDLLDELRAIKSIGLSEVFEAGLKRLLAEAKDENTVRVRGKAKDRAEDISGARDSGPAHKLESEATYNGTRDSFPQNSPFLATVNAGESSKAIEETQIPPPKSASSSQQVSRAQSQTQSRYIPKAIRQTLWERAEGRCEYKDRLSHRRCESRYRLEFEHCKPFAAGGKTHPDNMRVLCSEHNRLMAFQYYGHGKMGRHFNTLSEESLSGGAP